jgi:serine/threonine-protein kinase
VPKTGSRGSSWKLACATGALAAAPLALTLPLLLRALRVPAHSDEVRTLVEIGLWAAFHSALLSGLAAWWGFERLDARLRAVSRLVPPEALDAVLGEAPACERREVSVLWTDLRRFTGLSERLSPEEVVGLLNGFLKEAVESVLAHGGTVDKFVGDGVLAVFGSERGADHASRAVGCALDLRERIDGWNARRGGPIIEAGAAVHSGPAVLGLIGCEQRAELTIVGDTVNLAARLEGLNGRLGTRVLVSHSTYALTEPLGFRFRAWGLTPVRGRTEPVLVYEPMGRRAGECPRPGMRPKLGGYEVERLIGRGAMGAVYLARDARRGRRVAIKTLDLLRRPSGEREEEARRRFSVEAEAAGRLSHPAIVRVFAAGEDAGVPYIAMEYVEGQDLSKSLGSPWAPARAADLAARLAEGLECAHERGIVHRDVKPSNILLSSDGSVRLGDFGIARLLDGTGPAGTDRFVGTPRYMSPEQISGRSVDGRSDLFSLGVVLYELVAGVHPFESGDGLISLMVRIASAPHGDLRAKMPSLPPRLADAIERSLAKEPSSRWSSGGEMARALRAALS